MFASPQLYTSQRTVYSAGSFDAATTAWVNAVVSAGGAVSATQKTRVDTLIVALKGHSLFSTNSRLWLHAGESDSKQATIDIMGLATATPQNTPTLAAGGYSGNGTTSYVDLGTKPSDYTQNAGFYGVYTLTDSTVNIGDIIPIGAFDGSNLFADLTPLSSAATALYRINRFGGDNTTGTNLNRKGSYLAVSTGLNAGGLYKNGSSIAGVTNNTQNISGLPGFFICGRNNNGSLGSATSDQIAASFIGGSLDATQASNFSTDVNAYMTAWGINVY